MEELSEPKSDSFVSWVWLIYLKQQQRQKKLGPLKDVKLLFLHLETMPPRHPGRSHPSLRSGVIAVLSEQMPNE